MTARMFEVRGVPAPQGSKRHVGNGRMVESSKAVGPWREAVRGEAQRNIREPFPGAVQVVMVFRFPRPKGHYGTGRNRATVRPSAPFYPDGRPDVDKLARAVLDGLTMGGAFKDDAQVVELVARKMYGPPGVMIRISGLGEE